MRHRACPCTFSTIVPDPGERLDGRSLGIDRELAGLQVKLLNQVPILVANQKILPDE